METVETTNLIDSVRTAAENFCAHLELEIGFDTLEKMITAYDTNRHVAGVTGRQIDETTFILEEDDVFSIKLYVIS